MDNGCLDGSGNYLQLTNQLILFGLAYSEQCISSYGQDGECMCFPPQACSCSFVFKVAFKHTHLATFYMLLLLCMRT